MSLEAYATRAIFRRKLEVRALPSSAVSRLRKGRARRPLAFAERMNASARRRLEISICARGRPGRRRHDGNRTGNAAPRPSSSQGILQGLERRHRAAYGRTLRCRTARRCRLLSEKFTRWAVSRGFGSPTSSGSAALRQMKRKLLDLSGGSSVDVSLTTLNAWLTNWCLQSPSPKPVTRVFRCGCLKQGHRNEDESSGIAGCGAAGRAAGHERGAGHRERR